MMKIARRFKEDDIIVVILPDSGERYLSKIYDDEWMRANGFLVPERISARFVLESKRKSQEQMIAIDPTTTVRKALDLIREHDVSQIPVLEDGTSVGAVHDYELMSTVMERPEVVDAPVRTVMSPGFPIVEIDALIEDVAKLMTAKKNAAVLVAEHSKLRGILTRYDVIEFMSK
jgi:cystathionine beta-synthase